MKKFFSVIGMLAGIGMIVVGVLFLTGTFGGDAVGSVTAERYGATSEYGYAKFGADFYTYVSNNAYVAANNAYEAARTSAATANRVTALTELVRYAGGLLMIFFGLFGFCGFGVAFAGPKKKGSAPAETVSPAVPQQEAPMYTPVTDVPAAPAKQPDAPYDAMMQNVPAPAVETEAQPEAANPLQ